MNADTPKPHDEDTAESKAEGYTPVVEKPEDPIKLVPVWNAGKRATYAPPAEQGVRVKADVKHDKFARRMLRKRCWGANKSRVMNKLDKTWAVKAACEQETENGKAAQRLFDAEIADHRERRLAAVRVGNPAPEINEVKP